MRVSTAAVSLFLICAVVAGAEPRTDFAAGLAALSQRDFGAAEQYFRAVVTTDPSAHEAHNNLAVACAGLGRDDEAAEELQAAVRLRPDYERARRNLAAVYVRLAAKQLLAAAEHTEGTRRQALAANARDLLAAGAIAGASDLVARADGLAAFVPTATATPADPTAVPTLTPMISPTTIRPSATTTPTETPTSPATVTHAPLNPTTATPVVGISVPIVIEPIGAYALVVDPTMRLATLYRRDTNSLVLVGSWPITVRGRVGVAPMLAITRRSEWSVRLADMQTQRSTEWTIESASKATKDSDAVHLATTDFHAATGGLVPGRDVVLVLLDNAIPSLNVAMGTTLREQVESWIDRQRPKTAAGGRAQIVVTAVGDVAATEFEWASEPVGPRKRTHLVWRRQVDGTWEAAAGDSSRRDPPARPLE
ncbi:MAG: tetratricopeptide repeat protein [Deltaproteobacteria bacterium]|nr:tetratricopeptide repeat protein [Deltaproteobacteria bacterium]MBI3389285.1 tetratricopeptide repeat protein [Deltaproteobacteria bacterium]